MRRIWLSFALSLVVMLSGGTFTAAQIGSPAPSPTTDKLQILWFEESTPEFSVPRVYGEYQNITGQTIQVPPVVVVLEDKDGNIAGTALALPIFPLLAAEETLGFDVGVSKDIPPGSWSTVRFEICDQAEWDVDADITANLIIEDTEAIEQTPERLKVHGWINNTGDVEAHDTWVEVSAFRSTDGRFAGSARTSIDVAIPPGKRAAFTVTLESNFEMPGARPGVELTYIARAASGTTSGGFNCPS